MLKSADNGALWVGELIDYYGKQMTEYVVKDIGLAEFVRNALGIAENVE